jgi:tripartite-type tricarboxylate transporter receptor subunit TctC
VIEKLNGAMRAAVASREYQKRLDDLGSTPAEDAEMAPAYLARFVPQEIERFRKMLSDTK